MNQVDNNPFHGPALLIADARDDIYTMNELVRTFVQASDPLITCIEPGQHISVHKKRFHHSLSDRIPLLIRRSVGSLRSSLDQAVYASANTLGNERPKHTKFPFGDSPEQVDQQLEKSCRDVPVAIREVLRSIKPFPHGNSSLCRLNKLRNVKEHRLLVPSVVAGGKRFNLNFSGKKVMAIMQSPENETVWDPENRELTFTTSLVADFLAVCPVWSDATAAEPVITFYIVFAGIEEVRGFHVIQTLYNFADEVTDAVNQIESATWQIRDNEV